MLAWCKHRRNTARNTPPNKSQCHGGPRPFSQCPPDSKVAFSAWARTRPQSPPSNTTRFPRIRRPSQPPTGPQGHEPPPSRSARIFRPLVIRHLVFPFCRTKRPMVTSSCSCMKATKRARSFHHLLQTSKDLPRNRKRCNSCAAQERSSQARQFRYCECSASPCKSNSGTRIWLPLVPSRSNCQLRKTDASPGSD